MLRNRNFLLLLFAQCISAAGDTFTFLALAVRVDGFYAEAGESARALGGLLIAFALPQLVLSLFAGTLVDRWDRRKVMIASDIVRAILVPAYLFIGKPSDLPWAFAIAFLTSSFSVFFYPARTALVPELVEDKDLMAANGWMQVGQTIARLSGPILAGVIIGQWGVDNAFIIDAGSFVISALLLVGIMGVVAKARTAEVETKSPVQDLKEGLRFASRSRWLQGITVGIGVAMLGLGAVNVLFVPFLRRMLGAPPEGLGAIESAQGAGMLLGALAMGGFGKRLSPILVSVASMLMLGVSVALFGLAPAFWVALAIIPFVGLSVAPINASLQTLMQRNVPAEMLGRASAVMDTSISLTNLISMGAAGWLGNLLGLRQAFVFGGLMLILGGVAMGWLLKQAAKAAQAKPQALLGGRNGGEKMAVVRD
ncbi:MAG: MFS transporter [Anaerolineales bacterium]